MVVVNDFLNKVRDYIHGDTENTMDYMAWGDDNTPPVTTDTSLGNEFLRKQCSSRAKIGLGEEKYQAIMGTGEGNGNTIKEMAIFDAASAGTMMFRQLIEPIPKESSFSLTFEITFKAKRV